MISSAEAQACAALRHALAGIPDGAPVPDSDAFGRFLSMLEVILPANLVHVYDYWRGDSLDGVYPEVAQKISARSIELIGLGLTLNDQELLALWVRLGVRETSDEIEWLEARLGEVTTEGLRRTPYSQVRLKKEMYATAQRVEEIEWAFAVEARA